MEECLLETMELDQQREEVKPSVVRPSVPCLLHPAAQRYWYLQQHRKLTMLTGGDADDVDHRMALR